jgi:hypothetical protein
MGRVFVGPFADPRTHAELFDRTSGSGEPISRSDELRFSKDQGAGVDDTAALVGLVLRLPSDRFVTGADFAPWLDVPPLEAGLRLTSPGDFDLLPTTRSRLEPDERTLACIRLPAGTAAAWEHPTRVRVCPDLDLLFASDELRGWMLHRADRYLVFGWEPAPATAPEDELPPLLSKVMPYLSQGYLVRLHAKDAALRKNLQSLRDRLAPPAFLSPQSKALRAAIDDLVERYWG